MEHYLINSSICLFALWLFYKLAFENTSWHHLKRYFLLASIGISIVIPFIVVKTIVIPIETNSVMNFTSSSVVNEIARQQNFEFNWSFILWTTYGLGVIIMLWRFIKNLKAFRIGDEDELKIYSHYQLVLRNALIVPHSFLKRIFVSKNQYEENLIPTAVLEHEKAHLDQRHSLDILFIEILLILFWFNPLFYIMRYSIKLNHEFLADQAVIQHGIDTATYQETLLKYTQNSHSAALANTFNFPIIKKRFYIMKTQTSQASLISRSLALIPILALLIISCGKEETEFQEIEEILEIEEVVDDNHKTEIIKVYEVLENLTPEHIEEYNRLAIKHKNYMDANNNLIVFKDETQHMQTIFHSMSEEQQSSNEPWPYLGRDNDLKAGQIPPPPPPAPSAIEYINEHKNELNYYLREDQIPADVAIKIINDVGQAGVEISPDDKGVMSIKILETENNKGTLPPPPPPPVKSKTVSDKEFAEYNDWAKKNNEQNRAAKQNDNNGYAIIKQKDFEKHKSIYDRMSTSQKSEAQPLPTLPPPPPPAKDIKQISNKEVEEYNWLLNRHREFLKNEKRIVVFKEDTNRMIQLYTLMSVEQQSKNQAWHYLYKENKAKAEEILPPLTA
ncbi:M56 family metallopeptidase [Nonlabens ulvanivorans]|uniref:M56 family metallopeptidase n=1 Tax=Nonlabens ulvanivorans TaxID=906888 RepID=UPI002943635C|nr:M56 family metallopeptidase [Nonlabens ulvanivorans]WOI21986.1 M56 family metallopeptidase [Nonlabens ulvanivorans]